MNFGIFGGRKFFGTMLVELLSYAALLGGKLGGGEFVTISVAVLGIFAGTSVWQKIKQGDTNE